MVWKFQRRTRVCWFNSISNLEEFVKLNEIKFNGFNDVSLSELKTSVPVKLSYNFCDVISNLRQLLYKNTNIKEIKVLTDWLIEYNYINIVTCKE